VQQQWHSGLTRIRFRVRQEVVMSIKRGSEQVGISNAFAAPVHPLSATDLAVVRRAMAEIAPEWAVELENTCAGEATLVLVPDDGDDLVGPSFVISRETYGLRVDQVHWDALTEVGVFASLNEVLKVLHARLACCIDTVIPASITVH
jgi:hypothetical protein